MGSGNIKKFELKLGRTGLIIVIGGMVVLLCLSFILGVGVGKNMDTYPEKIASMPQRVLAFFWRPAKDASGEKVIEDKETPQERGSMDLAFHNALTSQKIPSIQDLPTAEKKPDDKAATEQKAKPKVSPAAKSADEGTDPPGGEQSGQQEVVNEKLPPENKAKIKEVPPPVQHAGSLFLVHVASLKDKVKANQIQKTVVAMGYPAKVTKADIKGKGTWYRVVATGFMSKTEAQTAAGKISKKVKTNCIIRPATQDAG
ncbi:MAG: SPOR domain-containing protein [Deltaproteobacteria bacterium]